MSSNSTPSGRPLTLRGARPIRPCQRARRTHSCASCRSEAAKMAMPTTPTLRHRPSRASQGQSRNLYRLFKGLETSDGWDRDRYRQEIELVTGDTGGDDRKLSAAQASDLIKSMKQHAGEEDDSRQGPPPEQSYGYSDEQF